MLKCQDVAALSKLSPGRIRIPHQPCAARRAHPAPASGLAAGTPGKPARGSAQLSKGAFWGSTEYFIVHALGVGSWAGNGDWPRLSLAGGTPVPDGSEGSATSPASRRLRPCWCPRIKAPGLAAPARGRELVPGRGRSGTPAPRCRTAASPARAAARAPSPAGRAGTQLLLLDRCWSTRGGIQVHSSRSQAAFFAACQVWQGDCRPKLMASMQIVLQR